jgi:hypothetical protein
MKTKIYLFRLIIGAMTLTLGIGAFFAWQFLAVRTDQEISQLEKPVFEIEKVQPVAIVSTSAPDMPQPDLPNDEENAKVDFDPDGSYYVLGDLPKAFRDFQSLDIATSDYQTREDGSVYAVPVPPAIYLHTETKYNFTRININNRNISFETQSKNGTRYRFVGVFPEEYEDKISKEWISLEGILTKLRNGKKVAETKARFAYIHGC